MDIRIKPYEIKHLKGAVMIWNQVVEDGVAFPQTETLSAESGHRFFEEQSFTGIAYDENSGEIVGLYILHPNNIGRCGHICNASYAVRPDMRGRAYRRAAGQTLHGERKELGFRILQFNAVVSSNTYALKLYKTWVLYSLESYAAVF